MTKINPTSADRLLRARRWGKWRITYDPSFVSARKVAAQRKLSACENNFVDESTIFMVTVDGIRECVPSEVIYAVRSHRKSKK